MRGKISIVTLIILMTIMIFGQIVFADEKFELTIYVGETIDLDTFLVDQQTVTAEDDMEWTSGNDDVVKVTNSGVVTGLDEGKATIYAKAESGSSKIATIKINVVSMVSDFDIEDQLIEIKIGEVYSIDYEITAIDNQDKVYENDVEWFTSNRSVVDIDDNGQIVGVKEGTAEIRGKTVDGGLQDTVNVKVSALTTDIVIDNDIEMVQVYVGGVHQFTATTGEFDVTNGVEWSSALEDILEIDDYGYAEGKKPGKTQVKAATKDKKKFDTVLVEVVSMVKDIEISKSKIAFENEGETFDLDYTLVPAIKGIEPFETDVKWSSSNSSIASVDKHGVVKAKERGTARIAVESVDGEHKAYCTVSVNMDLDKEVFVSDIVVEGLAEELLVGQEYELPIRLEPSNATEIDLVFTTNVGSSSQIDEGKDEDEGVYYFTPTQEGKYKITIKSESEVEEEIKIDVVSPIKDVETDLTEFVKEDKKYLIYVGQRIDLNPVFEFTKGYDENDLYEDEVKWTVEDKTLLKVDREKIENDDEDAETEYQYFLRGKKTGTTTLTIKSEDGDHETEIDIKVLSAYSDLKLHDNVTLPINVELTPEVIINMKDNLKYDLIDGVNYELERDLEISRQFVRVEKIEEEIAFEKDIIKDLQTSAVNNDNASVIYKEINEHQSRVSKLEIIKKTVQNGYCEIRDDVELVDVFGEDYVVATIDKDDTITGHRDGKIELKVTYPGTHKSDIGVYYFSSDLKGVVIVDENGEVVSISDTGFGKALTDQALKEQMALAIRIEERFGNRSDADTPDEKYAAAILNLEKLNIISKDLKSDYKKSITRIELAETFVSLIEYISDEDMKRPNGSSRFKDTTSKTAELAYELGIVDVVLPSTFDPYGEVTKVTFAKAVDRMITVLDAFGYNKEKLMLENDLGTGQKLFTDIENISDSNRVYIEKYASTYGLIEAQDNKLYSEKAMTREEFLYYVSKLVY